MKFGVLGPLTVRTADGAPVSIRGKRLRALLSVLLFHAGRPVPAHQLVDALWEGEPPKSYLSNLHTYVSRLRDRLPDLRIDHTDGLYTARVDPADLDLLVFRGRVDAARLAVRRGEHALAADLYRARWSCSATARCSTSTRPPWNRRSRTWSPPACCWWRTGSRPS
nr:hypothetical protein GCM10017745_25970 [Saccharothrix mutabilis subsp. capreolus]